LAYENQRFIPQNLRFELLNTDKTCALKIKMKRISELAYIVHPAWCVFVIQYTYIMINNNDNAWRRIKKNDVVIRTYVQ
jgi:hypothetical protein